MPLALSFFTTIIVFGIVIAVIGIGLLVLLANEYFAEEDEILPPSRPWLDDDQP